MCNVKERMIQQAQEKYGNITPCIKFDTLLESFTPRYEYGEYILWFEQENGSCAIFKESELKEGC